MRDNIGWCLALALAFGSVSAGQGLAQERKANADLSAVFADWQARQGLLKSASYVLVGTTEFMHDDRPIRTIRPRRAVLLIDVSKRRYRLEDTQEFPSGKGGYVRRLSTQAYDGKALQSLYHRKVNGIDDRDNDVDLAIARGYLGPNPQMTDDFYPLFFAHGIVPTVHAPLFVDRWPLQHSLDVFDVTGRQLLREQTCVVARTQPREAGGSADEFWISPEQKGAIYRHIYGSGPTPWASREITWKLTDHGWWVDHWSHTWNSSGSARRVYRFQVVSFTANPEVSDESFTLTAEPGMKVVVTESSPPEQGQEPSKATTTSYVVSPSGSWKEVPTKGSTPHGKDLLDGRRWWVVGAVGVLAGGLLGFLYLRHRRRQRAV